MSTEVKISAMQKGIQLAIEEVLVEEGELVIKRAIEEFEAKLREAVGKAVVRIASYADFETLGTTLRIQVRLTKDEA